MTTLLIPLALGAYAYSALPATSSAVDIGKKAPTSAAQLPGIDRYQPFKNDLIRPVNILSNDPLRAGFTNRVKNWVRGPYPKERYLGVDSVHRPGALWKQQNAQDAYVRSQSAYIPLNPILDNNFKSKGVQPQSRIRTLGIPNYSYVEPLTSSPV